MWLRLRALGVVSLAALLSHQVRATEPEKVARPGLADVPPLIDGHLDDPVWANAPVHGDFVERKPSLRGTPAEATTFQLLVDGHALYVAIRCSDSLPAEIRARTLQRDSDALFDDDAISVKIDPTRDLRTTYGFVLNAAGGRMDYRGLNEATWQFEFDTVWRGAAVRTASGWSAELEIPWAALGIDPESPPALTGFDISRDHSRLHATWDWALIAPPHAPIAAGQYGLLAALPELLAQAPRRADRKTWALVPWLLLGYADRPGAPLEAVADGGLDLEAELGNGFSATVTFNTDFAQVEVDDVVTNLDRFDLFLPEKRDFFLKDGDLFVFGEPGWASLFHSRTIGLAAADDGSVEVPILAGAKIGGRTSGGFRLGALSVLTRDSDGLPWRLDSVMRVQQALSGGSALGLMATHRQSLEDAADHNLDLGLDGAWRPAGSPFVMQSFVVGSVSGRPAAATLVDASAMLDLHWRGELFSPRFAYTYVGPSFRSDLGFFERRAMHNVWHWLALTPRLGWCGLESLQLFQESDIYYAAPGGALLDWGEELGARLDWAAGFWLALTGRLGEETVPAFDLAGRYPVAAGVHGQNGIELDAGTPTTEAVSLALNGFYGQHLGGHIAGFKGKLILRPGTALRAQLTGESAWVSLPSGSFNAPTLNLRLASGLTSDLELSGFVGWSGITDELSFQTRLRWTFLPGSDLFAVWELIVDDDSGAAGLHSLIAKLAWRFP